MQQTGTDALSAGSTSLNLATEGSGLSVGPGPAPGKALAVPSSQTGAAVAPAGCEVWTEPGAPPRPWRSRVRGRTFQRWVWGEEEGYGLDTETPWGGWSSGLSISGELGGPEEMSLGSCLQGWTGRERAREGRKREP